MRIAYITSEFPPDTGFGGIGTYTNQIAKVMLSNGHLPEIFTASFTREVSEIYNGYKVHRIRVSSLKEFRNKVIDKFSEIHEKTPFHLMECPEIGGEAQLIKEKYPNLPLIVRLHTPGVLVTKLQNTYLPLSTKLRFVTGSLLRGKIDFGYWSSHDKNQFKDPDYLITEKADLITAPSEAMKNWAVNFWRIKPERIKVIPNPFIPSKELLDIPLDSKTKRITFIGRLNVLKGLVNLTRAVPFVLKKHPDWQFRFIGKSENSHIKGVDMKSLMLRELKEYKNSIEFIDWIEYHDLPKYYADTEICVFPSLFESFSYVCAEAMSAGRAIVGSNRGGMTELLKNGNGILINPYNAEDISKAICKLIEDIRLRSICKIRSRDFVTDESRRINLINLLNDPYKTLIKSGENALCG